MCGFVGGTEQQWKYEEAIRALLHRGPDAQEVSRHSQLNLGFSRLSIIDLSSSANQPMTSADGTIRLVFNGEIYDYKSLRKDLERSGFSFRTHSDTEVLLHAYQKWGEEFVHHIDGMFSIAIHDLTTQKVHLFRDHAGIKPLFYFHHNGCFAFASELKGITTLCSDVSFEEDQTALYDFLTYRYIPYPKTLYKNCFELPPAHHLCYDLQEQCIQSIQRYWQAPTETKEIDLTQATKQLRQLIEIAVSNQLVADVPVGCFLSGGIDSSIVLYEAKKRAEHIDTFSIGFEQEQHSEVAFAKKMAEACRITPHIRTLKRCDTEHLFPQLQSWMDQPFAQSSVFPTYLVSQFAREKVTVALSGDGGDEVFGGYRWYQKFAPFINSSPGALKLLHRPCNFLRNRLSPRNSLAKLLNKIDFRTQEPLGCYVKLMSGMTHEEKYLYRKRWEIPKDYDSYWFFRQFYREELPLLTRLQILDFYTFLPCAVLSKVDRVSMAVSLEVRVPFLSKSIIEFAFSLPESIRYHEGELKGILKTAYRDCIPQDILYRPKKGFGLPGNYLNEMRQRMQDRILEQWQPISPHSSLASF